MPGYAKGRKGARKGKRGYRKSSKGLAKDKKLVALIKKITLKQNELKYVDYSHGKTELYHNIHNGLGINLLQYGPVQGDGDAQRIGNEVMLSGVKLTFMFYSKQDRPNTKFRVIIYSAPFAAFQPQSQYSTLFDDVTGNVMIDGMDKDAVKVHKSMMIYPKNISANLKYEVDSFNTSEVTTFRKVWVPYRTKLKYLNDTSTSELTNRTFYALVMAYDTYGTLVTDNIGAVQCWQRMFYRDP